jgi:hypothetical protein
MKSVPREVCGAAFLAAKATAKCPINMVHSYFMTLEDKSSAEKGQTDKNDLSRENKKGDRSRLF